MSEEDAIAYYLEKLEQVFINATPKESCAAIVFEPVQGEGGFLPAPIEWVKAVRKLCDDNGILMVCDEVQCGWGRSGKMFASEYFAEAGAAPDIMTTAKSIAGGLPLSAVTASREIMDSVTPGTIGGTYGCNAVSAASALALIDVMKEEDYPAKARHIADVCMPKFKSWEEKFEFVGNVRGMGAMIGIEFVADKASKKPNAEVVKKIVPAALKKGLMLEPAGTYGHVIRFLCPLCVTDAQLEAGLKIFEEVLETL